MSLPKFFWLSLVKWWTASGSLRPKSPSSPLCAAVEGLVTWDAVYFLRISEAGYEHEQTHAFFPLLPAVTRGVASASSALAGAVAGGSEKGSGNEKSESGPSRCALAASALAVSNSAHVAAAVVLQKLGAIVLANDDIDGNAARDAARSAAALFALNPASAFHSAPYTESIFALLSFAGFYFLERASLSSYKTMSSTRNRNGAALCFALACAARSNGALNSLVLAHDFFARVLPSVAFGPKQNKRRGKNAPGSRGKNASYVLPLFAATFAFAPPAEAPKAGDLAFFGLEEWVEATSVVSLKGGDPAPPGGERIVAVRLRCRLLPPAPEAKTFADAEGTETEKTEETETVRGGDGAGDAVTEPNEADAL